MMPMKTSSATAQIARKAQVPRPRLQNARDTSDRRGELLNKAETVLGKVKMGRLTKDSCPG